MPEPSPISDATIDDYLDRSFSTELSAAEERLLAQWIAASPERGERVARIRAAWEGSLCAMPAGMADWSVAREHVMRRIAERSRQSTPQRIATSSPTGVRAHVPRGHGSLGGSLGGSHGGVRAWLVWSALLVGLFVLVFTNGRGKKQLQGTIGATYSTRAGHTATVRLADGSSVILAPATSLTVRADHLALDGEAYFTVAPHAGVPFVVRTANATARVLGTQFSVRHYATDRYSRVVVDNGRVTVAARDRRSAEHRDVVLSAHMLGVVTDSLVTVQSDVVTTDYTGWMRGMLVFNQATVLDIAAALSRAYDVDIRVNDAELARERMRLDVSVPEQSIVQVLNLIGSVTGSHYSKTGRVYLLAPGRVPHSTTPTPQKVRQLPQSEKSYGR